jgi:hypothetical protein
MTSLRIVFTGYLVRFPLGGYAWQTAHYLLGLRALGHDVWFYEDNAYYAPAYNPVSKAFDSEYDYGVATTREFLGTLGLGERWVFLDAERGAEHGPGAGRAETLLKEADLLVNFGGVNYVPYERRGGRPSVYIDTDPVYTQLRLDTGDTHLRDILDAHVRLFTFGENIGTPRSAVPTGGYTWHHTRQPVALELWPDAGAPQAAFTTIGTWNSGDRDLTYGGQAFQWRKRTEWLRYLDLPARTGARHEMAMNVPPDDRALLTSHGWAVEDPITISADPWRYRDYVRTSRGEFTVAKDMNVRFRSGWFSDRGACYLAAGRPVVMQDTGFGDVLPLGPGLHAFRDLDEAAAAVRGINADYLAARAHAREVARSCFAADIVMTALLNDV